MGVDYTALQEGDALSATTLDTKLEGIATALNDLLPADIELEGLTDVHLPGIAASDVFTAGYEGYSPKAVTGPSAVYQNSLPAAGSPLRYTYQTFSTIGPNDPYGPGGVASLGGGWRIVAYANVIADAAEVRIATPATLATWNLEGVLVRGSVHIQSQTIVGTAGTVLTGHRPGFAIGIGFEDEAGNRYVIERSVRHFDIWSSRRGTATTSTFLTAAEVVSLGDDKLAAVFLVIACTTTLAANATIAQVDNGTTTRHYNLTAIPIHAGTL